MQAIVCSGHTWVSRLIELFTKSRWSHVALRYGGCESDWMVHATVGGVQPEWWHHFNKTKYRLVRSYEATFDVAEQAADNIIKTIGHKEYDYSSFLGYGVYIIANYVCMGAIKKNPFGQMNAFMCTEVLVEWMKECKRLDQTLPFKDFDSELTSPEDLFKYWETLPEYFKFIEERVNAA